MIDRRHAGAEPERELARHFESLVQGILGLSMQLQASVSWLPRHHPVRVSAEASLALMDRMLADSMDRLGHLLPPPRADDVDAPDA